MTTSTAPAPTAVSSVARPARDAYFDNAKFLAIVLVALGHTWGPLISNNPRLHLLRGLYLLVYAFHMPLFILVSGWFSRSFAAGASDPVRIRRLLGSTVVPYLIFVTAYELYDDYRHHQPLTLDVTRPFYLTWFLVALFLWRVTAPIWLVLRAPVLVATLVMIGCGFASFTSQFDLAQVLQFLPFFVLGLTVRREHVEWIRDSRWLRAAAVAVFTAAVVASVPVGWRMPPGWFYRDEGHQQLHVGMLSWVVHSVAMALAGLILSVAFLALVPRRRCVLTTLGAGTQYTYLLHGFFVQAALAYGFEYTHFANSRPGQVLITLAVVLLAGLLATPPVRRLFRWAVEPDLGWAVRRPAR